MFQSVTPPTDLDKPDTDKFFAAVFGKHVLVHLFDDTGARLQMPTQSVEHLEFYARLAASYGLRALGRKSEMQVIRFGRRLVRDL